jgi:subtilisin family serine protease
MWGLRKVGAPAAWDRTTGDRSVVVAVIDTGVDFEHEDLKDNMWVNTAEAQGTIGVDDDGNGVVDDVHGANFVRRSGNPMDRSGHGTHVAGTIGAVGSSAATNAKGVVGMNWRVSLMAVRFAADDAGGSTAAAVKAIHYAVKMGAHIINASWGGEDFDATLEQAIQEAGQANVLFVCAVGEDLSGGIDIDKPGSGPDYPASFDLDNILAVQGSDSDDELVPDSFFGRVSVDIAAPGFGILSTVPNNDYDKADGTSTAAPHVSGAAALIKALAPNWGYLEIKRQLLGTAKRCSALRNKSVTGGRLDADAATQAPVRILTPQSSEQWQRGKLVTVSWKEKFTPSSCTQVDLAISTDGGATWNPLATGIDVTLGEAKVQAPSVAAAPAQVRLACSGTRLFAFSPKFAIV